MRDRPRVKPLLLLLAALSFSALNAASVAERVILITLDGVRCQEMFQGLDLETWQAHNEGKDITATPLYERFWAETPEERRAKVMPFFWNVLMKDHGAIAGNRFNGSVVKLTNRLRFSYPGYSELLTGVANDAVIKSNAKVQNPRPTVLDFLRDDLRLTREQVAIFASWDVFNWIATHRAGNITANAGFAAFDHPDPAIRVLSELQFQTPTPWNNVRHDIYTFQFALAHLRTHRPVVLHLALGETDDSVDTTACSKPCIEPTPTFANCGNGSKPRTITAAGRPFSSRPITVAATSRPTECTTTRGSRVPLSSGSPVPA